MINLNFEKNLQLPWWIRIVTTNPSCIYYFGPFDSLLEAQSACPGYVEDLLEETAQVVMADIDKYQPQDLTIDMDLLRFGLKKWHKKSRHELNLDSPKTCLVRFGSESARTS